MSKQSPHGWHISCLFHRGCGLSSPRAEHLLQSTNNGIMVMAARPHELYRKSLMRNNIQQINSGTLLNQTRQTHSSPNAKIVSVWSDTYSSLFAPVWSASKPTLKGRGLYKSPYPGNFEILATPLAAGVVIAYTSSVGAKTNPVWFLLEFVYERSMWHGWKVSGVNLECTVSW